MSKRTLTGGGALMAAAMMGLSLPMGRYEAPSTVSPRAPREPDPLRDELLEQMKALKAENPRMNRKARRREAQRRLKAL